VVESLGPDAPGHGGEEGGGNKADMGTAGGGARGVRAADVGGGHAGEEEGGGQEESQVSELAMQGPARQTGTWRPTTNICLRKQLACGECGDLDMRPRRV
jgi:hypothetical protein